MGWVGSFLVENDGLSAQTVRVSKGFDLVVVKGSVWGFKGKRWLEKSSIKGFRRLGLQFWDFGGLAMYGNNSKGYSSGGLGLGLKWGSNLEFRG